LFKESCPDEFNTYTNASVLFSSHSNAISQVGSSVYPTSDGFIRGTIDAWAQHQHLVLRPEEVWFEILAQMNFYMSANSEAIRNLFVDFQGQEEILIEDYTWELVLGRFKYEIQKRVKTDWLLDWIMPNFTTTTETDVMTANVLMMGLMKGYFRYVGREVCGLPSVTLEGSRADWEKLLKKLERLVDFGADPLAYSQQLRPILSRFVKTFDSPDDPEIRTFWNSIMHAEPNRSCGAPPYSLNGWLMGFFYWDSVGKPLSKSPSGGLALDGVNYARRLVDSLPVGYAQAPFTMLDYPDRGTPRFEAYVLAGNVGKQFIKGLPDGYAEALHRFNGSTVDTSLPHGILKPLSGWMIYGPGSHNVTVKRPDHDREYEAPFLKQVLDRSGVDKCKA